MNFFFSPLKVFSIFLVLILSEVDSKSSYLDEGIILFEKNEFVKSKILFERNLVFDPKNEESYLYLAKIFNKNNNDEEQEINLNNVLLLNPQNDEAIYMLTILKIKQSDYDQAKHLIDKFILVCKSFCSKEDEMQQKLKKLVPEDAKSNN